MDRRLFARHGAALAGVAAVMVLAAAGQANAQNAADKKRAQELQIEGVRLMENGDSQRALETFEQALRLFPSPKILFNIGLAHKARGKDVDAVNDFERFLDEAPYAPKQSRDTAERIINEIRPRLSYIEIGTDDAGSRISIDGHEVGVAPLPRPLAVNPGAHEIRLEKAGMQPASQTVSPVPGQKVRVFVKLVSIDQSPPPAGVLPHPPVESERPPEPPPPNEVTPARLHETGDSPPPAAGAGTGRRALKWVAWGAALAGASVGAYGALHNSSLVDDFDQGCGLTHGVVITDGTGRKTQIQCTDLKTQYESAGRLGLIGFIAAGALSAAGFAFWATEPSAASNRVAGVSCVPTLSAGLAPSVACAFRF
jgi:hypothetical protein